MLCQVPEMQDEQQIFESEGEIKLYKSTNCQQRIVFKIIQQWRIKERGGRKWIMNSISS